MSSSFTSDTENENFSEASTIVSSLEDESFQEEEEECYYANEEDFDEEDEYYLEDYEQEIAVKVYPKVDVSIPAVNPWNKNKGEPIAAILSISDIIKSQEIEKKKLEEMKEKNLKKRAKFSFPKAKKEVNNNTDRKTSLLLGKRLG
jgi:hypothetical protein